MKRAALVALVLCVACQKEEPPPQEAAEPAPGTPEFRIRQARSAAPWVVSAGAQVLELPAESGAAPVELAAGTNGWTCIVDFANTPDPDPVCADSVFGSWVDAWQRRQPPQIRAMGVAYMLRGGQIASDSDPFKMTPDPGQQWMVDPPHLMIVMPNPRQAFAGLPTARREDGPWVMFAGTPYAHLMVPAAGSAAAPARP